MAARPAPARSTLLPITMLYRGRGAGHYDLIVPPVFAERLLAAGDVNVEWVSATPWA